MPRKITDEVEYAKALQRIEQLMFRVLPGSPEGEELERLSKEVELYENENCLFVNTFGAGALDNSVKPREKSKKRNF